MDHPTTTTESRILLHVIASKIQRSKYSKRRKVFYVLIQQGGRSQPYKRWITQNSLHSLWSKDTTPCIWNVSSYGPYVRGLQHDPHNIYRVVRYVGFEHKPEYVLRENCT